MLDYWTIKFILSVIVLLVFGVFIASGLIVMVQDATTTEHEKSKAKK